MPSCVKPVAGDHAVGVWQLLHSVDVGMCVAPLPLAVVPLWQLEHEPTTSAWSTRVVGFQVVTEWQDSQLVVVKR